MASMTSRLGLRKAEYTDPESVIPDVDNNMDTIDDAVNANIFTSSTRPSNPHSGRLIYETDTKLVAIFLDSSGWHYIGGNGFARGKKAVITADGDSSTTTNNVEIIFISVTFTAEAGRRYWVESTFCLAYTPSGGSSITGQPRIRWATGATVTTAGTQLGSDVISNVVFGSSSSQDFYMQQEFVPNINGQVTVGLFINTASTTRNIFFDQATDRSAQLFVRDVGAI